MACRNCNTVGNPEQEAYYNIVVSFGNGLRNIPNVQGSTKVFQTIALWLKEPGTHWVRVFLKGEKIFEWVRE